MQEGFKFPRGFASMFNVGRSIAQVIGSGVWTVLQWNWENFDILDEMAIVNPWTFVPKQRGYYRFSSHIRINNLPVGAIFAIYFRLNGVNWIAGAFEQAANLNEDITLNIHGLEPLAPTDAVDVVVWHNAGVGCSIQGNLNESRFFGHRVR